MFGKKKNATKSDDLMNKVPAAGAMELGDDVLEATAGGYTVTYTECPSTSPTWAGAYVLRGFEPNGKPVRRAFKDKEGADAWAKKHGIH